jgi:hypothetical protein
VAKLDVTYAYAADIVKSERDPETGDLMVYGKATGTDLDLDGQRCDPAWLKTAMPAWMEWGNVREQHGMVAAGVGVELTETGNADADWMLLSRCVDPGTARKIEAGVLKGYSISVRDARVIKSVAAPNGVINDGKIVEISYVDRPCLPTARTSIVKSAGLAEDGESIEVEDGAETPLLPVEADLETDEGEPVIRDGEPMKGEPTPVENGNAWAKSVGADLARRVRRLVPDERLIVKAAPDEDIATAQQAITVIAQLIQSEAASLADGQLCDADQIGCLLRAVDALAWFCRMEADEPPAPDGSLAAMGQAQTDDMSTDGNVISMAVEPDTLKAQSTTTDTDVLVKAAVTEAMKAHEAELATLRAQLAKVSAMPVPGGPVLARPRAVIAKAGEREQALAKAEQYDSMARTFSATDPKAARGYAQMAAQLRQFKDVDNGIQRTTAE